MAMLYPNPFVGPGACAGGNGYCATHEQPVLACENEGLLSELVTMNKRVETAEAQVRELREREADTLRAAAQVYDELEAQVQALREALADLIDIADRAMQDANRDGAGYDRVAELAEARAVAAPPAPVGREKN